MEELMNIIEKAKEKLIAEKAFSNVEIQSAYAPVSSKRSPISPQIVIEQGAVTVKSKALGDYISGGRGKRAKAAIKFTIISPLSNGPQCCSQLFSKLCQTLIFDSEFGVISMTAGTVKLCSDKSAYELTATAVFETTFFYHEEEGTER